ncbi:MAG: PAS domain-containing sensor histidine kinase [Pseudomonadota bacterium]
MAEETPEQEPPESFRAFLDGSRTGFLYTKPDGRIVFANARMCDWLQIPASELVGSRFSDLLPIARKIYYETHLAPLLRMQGFFDEVFVDLSRRDGTAIPVLLGAAERHDAAGKTMFVSFTAFPASERRQYERNLIAAKTTAVSDSARLREQLAEDARARMTVEERLAVSQNAAALREQFIAVLGHDLRNPLAAIDGAMRLIAKTPLNERATSIVGMVRQSVERMADLIDNVMDFARGRLGGGLTINPRNTEIAPVLEHVIGELEIAWPERVIERDFQVSGPVYCDGKRIGQLLSNLLGNALSHGAAQGPVRVIARSNDASFSLAVANTGDPIPPDALERLFEPFTREDLRSSQQGLGLGLYICSEIARSHQGELSVESNADETRFTLSIPLQPSAKLGTTASDPAHP